MLSFFPRDVLDEILNLIGSVSEGFPSYSYITCNIKEPQKMYRLGMVSNRLLGGAGVNMFYY